MLIIITILTIFVITIIIKIVINVMIFFIRIPSKKRLLYIVVTFFSQMESNINKKAIQQMLHKFHFGILFRLSKRHRLFHDVVREVSY